MPLSTTPHSGSTCILEDPASFYAGARVKVHGLHQIGDYPVIATVTLCEPLANVSFACKAAHLRVIDGLMVSA